MKLIELSLLLVIWPAGIASACDWFSWFIPKEPVQTEWQTEVRKPPAPKPEPKPSTPWREFKEKTKPAPKPVKEEKSSWKFWETTTRGVETEPRVLTDERTTTEKVD